MPFAVADSDVANRVLDDGIAMHIADRFTAIALHDVSQYHKIEMIDDNPRQECDPVKLRSRQVPDVFCDEWRNLVSRFPINDSTMLGAAMLAFAELTPEQQSEYATRATQLVATGKDAGKRK